MESAEDESRASRAPEKRTSRACLHCRKRKSQCLLPTVNGVVTTPCKRCKSTGQECVIGSSNRGGRRVRKRKFEDDTLEDETYVDSSAIDETFDTYPAVAEQVLADGFAPTVLLDPALQQPSAQAMAGKAAKVADTRESSTGASIAFDQLQNPSDALGILAQIASHGESAIQYQPLRSEDTRWPRPDPDPLRYELVKSHKISVSRIIFLLDRYKRIYHQYFPIVPAATLDSSNLSGTASLEPVLLTAILVIASRDLIEEPELFAVCTEHMRALVSELAAGGNCDVSAVEALLLLAEWTPYTSRSDAGHVGRGEEDREAWMHVGIALRIAYFLGLDRYSFHVRDDAKDPQWQRKRLTWTACYISDRQISIRLGRAFWSRGPGPLTTLRKEDFPMLAPLATGGEDYASIFQATLELTMLFSNVHDVLYSNPGNSMRSHLSGGYIKYIDDFRTAIYGWKSVWGGLTCNPALKATLLMSYDYLRLYLTAFAFHATIKRAVSTTSTPSRRHSQNTPGRIFYNNVGAVGDARFIYEGLDAAKSLLSMVNTFVDPEQSLRYMPIRFYLYSIYSGVFLYRARIVGVLSTEEEQSVQAMVAETINRLERSGLGKQHPGSRYSRLLRMLWDKVERKDRKSALHTATLQNPYRPGSADVVSIETDSPSVHEAVGDFSWTDLDAIGNYVEHGSSGINANEADWWSGFLPADSNGFLFSNMPDLDGWGPATM